MDLKETPDLTFTEDKRHPWELARIKIISDLIASCIPFQNSKNNISIVDIGCGDAFLLNRISAMFHNPVLSGIDSAYSNDYIEILKKTYSSSRLELYNSIDSFTEKTTRQADIVLLLDVIEHIEADHSFIKDLRSQKWVTADTCFIITVPAFQQLFSNHDIFLGHYRRYSNNSLRNLLNTNGFEIIDSGYFFISLLAARILTKFAEIIIPRDPLQQKGAGAWKGNTFISKILISTLWIDFLLSTGLRKVGIKLPGLSNYAVCRISV